MLPKSATTPATPHAEFLAAPWAILESELPRILAQIREVERGNLLEYADPEASAGAIVTATTISAAVPQPGQGGVMVLPLRGPIYPRENMMTRHLGWPALSTFRAQLTAAMADTNIAAVVLDIDSPGGPVQGLAETAELMRSLRGKDKPIVAVANIICASSAYWLAAQADLVVAAPDSIIGNIGTLIVHSEISKALEMEGVKTTIFRNPPRKADGNNSEPLTEEASARLQELVDIATAKFHADVAKGRGVTAAAIRAGYGQGIVLMEQEALAAKMVDRVESLDRVLARLTSARGRRLTRAQMLAEWPAEGALAEAAPTDKVEISVDGNGSLVDVTPPEETAPPAPARQYDPDLPARRQRMAEMA